MDITLQPGDLLYMPRGTIHQGNCLEDIHSLHITVSCHQLNTYGDLMEKLLPVALKTATEEDIEFRKGEKTFKFNDFLTFSCLALLKVFCKFDSRSPSELSQPPRNRTL